MSKNRPVDVHIFFTEEEMKALEEKMRRYGVNNRSAFIRKMAIDGYCLKLDLPEIREMTKLLARCSSNLNQYAKVANSTGGIRAKDMASLQAEFADVRRVADQLLAGLMQIPGVRL